MAMTIRPDIPCDIDILILYIPIIYEFIKKIVVSSKWLLSINLLS
tara:strand:- start:89 stop:223 length:135 start_codon:yes stop_codon:yes gene_type:complete